MNNTNKKRQAVQRRIAFINQRLAERPNDRYMAEEREALLWLLERQDRVQGLIVGFEVVRAITLGKAPGDGDPLERIRAICNEVLGASPEDAQRQRRRLATIVAKP